MQPTAPAATGTEPPVLKTPLPKRTCRGDVAALHIPAADPNDTTWYTAHIHAWAHRQTDDTAEVADRVARIAVALVHNAHRWTRSGLPGGRAELEIVRGRFDLQVSVTDQGAAPCPSGVCSFPLARPRSGGLRTVEELSLYWDWEGGAATPITVRALVDRRPL
ncbi:MULTISPECIES: hypothetical protein [unclassified Nocardiopsis]|uniref:hypothetical protein n=1 Tax=Nocardiopsis TaxID=2013 RepID=UPI00387A9238